MDRTLRHTWLWEMPAPPQRVWPLVSDTSGFNRAIGLGPWTFSETPNPLGGSLRLGSAPSMGGNVTWDERPFHWVEGREFSVDRIYHSGPFRSVRSNLVLEPADNGTTLSYTIEAVVRSLLWGPVARYYLSVHTRRQFRRAFGNVARYLQGQAETAYPQPTPVSPGPPGTGSVKPSHPSAGPASTRLSSNVLWAISRTHPTTPASGSVPTHLPTRGARTGRRSFGSACMRPVWASSI